MRKSRVFSGPIFDLSCKVIAHYRFLFSAECANFVNNYKP